MKIKSIKPNYVPELIQCEALINLEIYNERYLQRREERCKKRGWKTEQCTSAATIDFRGKMYCRAHAGQVTLADALEEERPTWARG